MPVPSRYTVYLSPVFFPKALQASEASEVSEVPMGPFQGCVLLFFLGVRQKQKQFALSSFRHESITNLVPGVQKRLEVMAMGHDMP